MNLTPFLLFDGNCAQAMAFYQSCLGGELTITKVADMPMKDHMPPDQHQKVARARLKSGLMEFSATDWLHPTRTPKPGNTVAMYITGVGHMELRAMFDKLAVGAEKELLDDLRDMPFGSYGHLADKYGVHGSSWERKREPDLLGANYCGRRRRQHRKQQLRDGGWRLRQRR